MEPQISSSVSQAIEDDDCGSFFVVQRWSTPSEVIGARELDNISETTIPDIERSAESLNKDETVNSIPHTPCHSLSTDVAVPTEIEGEFSNAQGTPTPINQDAAGNFNSADDMFSMTNYSTTSSSSEQQLEDLQSSLNEVISDHKKLRDLLEKQNLELELRNTTIEELKLLAKESVAREKEKSEEYRQVVEKLTNEKESALVQVQTLTSLPAKVALDNLNDFETLETLEGQLKQRDEMIQQSGEQLKELSARLHQEMLQCDQLKELLRVREESDKQKSDSLSSSDEALARSISDRERLEGIVEESQKVKMQLQQEIVGLREQLESVQSENSRLQTLGEKVDAKCAELDHMNRGMAIQLAALQAENERLAELLNEEISKSTKLAEENVSLQQNLGKVDEMLQTRTTELQNLQAQTANGMNVSGYAATATSPISSIPSQVYGYLSNRVKGYGFRDANDDPNEPYSETFEHVRAGAPAPQPPAPTRDQDQCPICRKRFPSLRKLEIHASNCGMDMAERTDPFVFP